MKSTYKKTLLLTGSALLLSGCTEVLSFGVGFGAGYATHYFIAQNQQSAPQANDQLAQRTLAEMRGDAAGAMAGGYPGMAQYPAPTPSPMGGMGGNGFGSPQQNYGYTQQMGASQPPQPYGMSGSSMPGSPYGQPAQPSAQPPYPPVMNPGSQANRAQPYGQQPYPGNYGNAGAGQPAYPVQKQAQPMQYSGMPSPPSGGQGFAMQAGAYDTGYPTMGVQQSGYMPQPPRY